jgi:hypothetical protein
VYIAGPYTASTHDAVLDNVHAALDAGIALIGRGHTPFIPHLSHWVEKRNERESRAHGFRLDYEDYMRIDQAWLECCEALLYLAPSPGADRELAWAEANGLTIYRSVLEVPPVPAVVG